MGSSRYKTIKILGLERAMLMVMSALVASVLHYLTGFFVDDFIRYFIL
jgi:hypothetical protein